MFCILIVENTPRGDSDLERETAEDPGLAAGTPWTEQAAPLEPTHPSSPLPLRLPQGPTLQSSSTPAPSPGGKLGVGRVCPHHGHVYHGGVRSRLLGAGEHLVWPRDPHPHPRQRGQVPPDATIALLAEDGHLGSLADGLEEGPSLAPSVASPPLQEQGTYVRVQIISTWGPRFGPPAVTLEYKRRDSIHGHPCPAEPPAWPGPSPVLPTQCPVLSPGGDSKHVQSWGGGYGPPACQLASECHSHRRAWAGGGRLPTCALRQGFPGLTEELRWRSGLLPEGDGQRRRLGTRRGPQEQGPPSQPRRVGSLLSRTQELGPRAR
ncbi:uncharacterized protein C22orf15 homolog [Oryx dammah]|uniref:uncharacterized protein C22orf15 homolog n=1 Tax=Oryx dammah TaxID=59534 RepID=UPI001A9BDF4B|nr:uncharacterized protein C22orf15 homolog [Oryx dammah]